jgi:GT2 family glycosyltransferase/glycosyltransferase involved in cell wall biosynthesis
VSDSGIHVVPRQALTNAPLSEGDQGAVAAPSVHIKHIHIEDSADYRTLSLEFSLFNLEVSECDVHVGFAGAQSFPVASCQIVPSSQRESHSVEIPRFRCDGRVSFPFDPWSFPSRLIFHVKSAGSFSYVLRTTVDIAECILKDIEDSRLVDALGVSFNEHAKAHEAILRHLRFLRGRPTGKRVRHESRQRACSSQIERYVPTYVPHDSCERRRVCLVTKDILGPIRDGEVATWCVALAEVLRSAGCDVTILYAQEYFEQGNRDLWVHHYKAQGIQLEFLPESRIDTMGWPAVVQSFRIYEWLKEQSFDVVHFHEINGCGYYSLLAKRSGLSFMNTTLCVGLHGPARWHRYFNKQFVCWQEELASYWMEKECLRLADVAFSSSQYLFSWALEEGWELPERCWILPHPLLEGRRSGSNAEAPSALKMSARRHSSPNEFVFFGRLESCNGLELFCDALDMLDEGAVQGLRIAFIGKPGIARRIGALEYLELRGRNWRFSVSIMSDFSRDEAVTYLSSGGKVVVIPSLAASSSYALYECLQAQIPVLCADGTGLRELIQEEDREAVMFQPGPRALAEKLEDTLVKGGFVPRPTCDFSTVNQMWLQFHVQHLFPAKRRPLTRPSGDSLVSICVVHHNRPELLEQALDSVYTQTYRHMEVIVVDDGSTEPGLQAHFERMKGRFTGLSLEFVKGDNRFPGASRNIAAGLARGEYVLFLDDDNLMKESAVDTLVRAAQSSGAEIVSPLYDMFSGSEDPRENEGSCTRWLLAGPGLAIGITINSFGDSFSLYHRAAFLRLGGFSEDRANDTEDWELLVRANMAGFRHITVPEALLWYRRASGKFRRMHLSYTSSMRRLRPYGAEVSDRLFDVILATCGMEQNFARVIRELRKSAEGSNESWLQAEFHDSQSNLFSTNRPGGFDDIASNEEVCTLKSDKSLEITATGEDPQLLLPQFESGFAERLCMRIRITAPTSTFIQAFYTVPGRSDYCEELSVKARIRQGFSEVYLLIPHALVEGRIRLDPGGQSGDYIIHSIDIRGCSE